mmetsp:Transcript_69772/g.110905  ORF Transcript_69772/g.110905 Transcript_69772/m.110905 type:complete len:128 (+) Transcript_69772:7-390(+)
MNHSQEKKTEKAMTTKAIFKLQKNQEHKKEQRICAMLYCIYLIYQMSESPQCALCSQKNTGHRISTSSPRVVSAGSTLAKFISEDAMTSFRRCRSINWQQPRNRSSHFPHTLKYVLVHIGYASKMKQ